MNERSKKIYAIIIAILLVLSIATSFLPSIQVKASTTVNITQTPWYSLIPSGSELFEAQYYNIDDANLDDEIKYGCNSGILIPDNDAYYSYFTEFQTFLNDKDNYSGIFNGGQPFNDINFVTNDNELQDVFENPSNYSYALIITQTSSSIYMSFYYSSTIDLSQNIFMSNNGGYYYDATGTIRRFDIWFTFTNDASHVNTSPNVFTQGTSAMNTSQALHQLYCSCPLYFVYAQNQYGSTYSNLNSSANIRDFLNDGNTSPFLIDRRQYFSNFSGGNLTPETDPISQEYVGAWDIDLVPVDDLLNGSLKVKYTPTAKLTENDPNYSVKYYFSFFFNGKKFNWNVVSDRDNINLGLSQVLFGSSTSGGSFKSVDIKNYYNISDNEGITVNSLSNDYITLPTSTVLQTLTPVGSWTLQSGAVGGSVGNSSNPLNVYQSLKFYMFQNCFNQQVGGGSDATFGPVSVNLTPNQAGVTTAKLTVQAQAFYNGSEATNVATATYNYLTGEVTKQGTVSTGNDTAIDSETGVPEGLTPSEQDAIQNSTQNIVTNGGNTNTNTNNPSFVNNNNPTITIENNNGGGWLPSGDDDTQEGGILSQFWAVWSTFEVIQSFTQAVNDNEFLSFIFSSELWQVPGMSIIIPSLVIMILVSILSTIVRFIRGN